MSDVMIADIEALARKLFATDNGSSFDALPDWQKNMWRTRRAGTTRTRW